MSERSYRHPDAIILVFARAPVVGQVKTRLARRIGPAAATRWHRQMTLKTLTTLHAARLAPVWLVGVPDIRHPFFFSCRRRFSLRLRRQSRGDLGRRMNHALCQALRVANRAVLIGTDCPALGYADLDAALQHLARGAEIVLGPSTDGGYVLVGANRPAPGLFHGIDWGTERVMAQTYRRLSTLNRSWRCLPPKPDVDHYADLQTARRAGWL
ncbi:MAG: TIGR04282 family arsenosugar biosynthesis glycosyltransferase [Pseudomonadota bacterium]|nr:TIGR04282 family arsenosugar biosynthesis glycosyltransferase [Pseudomonadota bacterium]